MNCNAFVKIGFSFFFFLRIYLTTSHRYHILITITNLILNKKTIKQILKWYQTFHKNYLSINHKQSPRGSVLKNCAFLVDDITNKTETRSLS